MVMVYVVQSLKQLGRINSRANVLNFQKNSYEVRCSAGDVVVTHSYALEKQGIRHIIHAVGPDCRVIKDPYDQRRLLYAAYTKSLESAASLSLNSIAFPFISSGIFACSPDLASETALEAVNDFIKRHPGCSLKEIRFVLFDADSFNLFEGKKNKIF